MSKWAWRLAMRWGNRWPWLWDMAYRVNGLCACCSGYGCHEDWFADSDDTDECLVCNGSGKA